MGENGEHDCLCGPCPEKKMERATRQNLRWFKTQQAKTVANQKTATYQEQPQSAKPRKAKNEVQSEAMEARQRNGELPRFAG